MDVKVFKTFLEVTRTRHFGRAADNLFITQAAVSARIKHLEEFIGAPLFDRLRNNLQLTPAGERLIPYAETMVRALQQARQGASLAEIEVIQLSFAATPNVWDAYLQNYLTVILDALPNISFNSEIASSQQLTSSVISGTVDLTVLFDPFLDTDVTSEKIADIDLVLVSTVNEIDVERALSSNYVFVDWGTQFAAEHSAKYGDTIQPVLRTSTGRIALDCILARGGSAYLPRTLVSPFVESQQLFLVSEHIPMQRSVYAIFRKDNVAVSTISQLVRVIDQSRPERPVILETIASSGD